MTQRERPSAEKLPGGPEEEPVFAEPWEAQAFALAVKLQADGHFTAAELHGQRFVVEVVLEDVVVGRAEAVKQAHAAVGFDHAHSLLSRVVFPISVKLPSISSAAPTLIAASATLNAGNG